MLRRKILPSFLMPSAFSISWTGDELRADWPSADLAPALSAPFAVFALGAARLFANPTNEVRA
jgi:uncharacterized membrane protein